MMVWCAIDYPYVDVHPILEKRSMSFKWQDGVWIMFLLQLKLEIIWTEEKVISTKWKYERDSYYVNTYFY